MNLILTMLSEKANKNDHILCDSIYIKFHLVQTIL